MNDPIVSRIQWKETARVRFWALLNVPLLYFVRPSVLELTASRCVVRIRLRHRTRNHLGSMYFGSLCAGADCAGGLIAMRAIEAGGGNVSLIFKDFRASFLRRPEGDVHFMCEDGLAIRDLVQRTRRTGQREEAPVKVTATVSGEPVAEFQLTLSLKMRSKA